MRWTVALLAASAIAACGRPPDPLAPLAPIQVVIVGEPEPAPPPLDPVATAPPPERSADAGKEELPAAWLRPVREPRFQEAIFRARTARAGYFAVGSAPSDAGAARAWFERAAQDVDLASRLYAGAFYAEDARPVDQLDAIAEAAELGLGFAAVLDAAGLTKVPPEWRTDPTLALTFEDVDIGPSRRWRDEARALAKTCVELGRTANVDSDATRRCATLRTGSRALAARRADASACPCQPGDPLCSAMGGWCAP